MGAVLAKLLQVFWTKKLDIVVIGLENRCVSLSLSLLVWLSISLLVPSLVLLTHRVKCCADGESNF
jgi:hypothetical protein